MAPRQVISATRYAASRSMASARSMPAAFLQSIAVFLRDVCQGMLDVSHNTLALTGLLVVTAVIFFAGRAELRHEAESWTLDWLQARQDARVQPMKATMALALAAQLSEPDAVMRATASDPKELSRQQAAVVKWLARRYRVAPEPISRLVQEAWSVGQKANLDPTLILAIMAVESSFNPFAQSSVGAQGLMQVMTKVHNDKYEAFGGNHAAFDPVTNLRVGVQVLKECIARAGGLEAGLRFYVGAGNLTEDGGYAGKVLSEQSALRQVANGKLVPTVAHPTLINVATPVAKPEALPEAAAAADLPEQVALLH